LHAELTEAVSGDFDFRNRAVAIAELLSREMADVCVIDIVDEENVVRCAHVACRDLAKQPVCEALRRRRLGSSDHPVTESSFGAAGEVSIHIATTRLISSWASSERDRVTLENAGFSSAMVAPLRAHGRPLGIITLLTMGPQQRYGQIDALTVEAFAQRSALFLDNARLFSAATRATTLRDEMMGVVAHDLRNPLAAIVTLAAVLRKTGAEDEIVTEIEHAARRMSRLIQDIIDVTRLEAGRLTLEQAKLSAIELLSEAIEKQRPLASAVSLEYRLDPGAAVPDIWVDSDRLLQVFENLIGNAIKFTPPGGRVTVGATAREQDVLFRVADTGMGIEADDLSHVFDRFWQAPGAKRRGAGLGLAIVKGIVEAHGGDVWVESKPGQGSTFFFTIPIAPADSNSPVRSD
jgi:signal transduction histidine kinase